MCVALIDFSGAFDLVDHDILLLELKSYNFSDGAINWIKSYLAGRISMVNINGEFSSSMKIVSGVLQEVALDQCCLVYLTIYHPFLIRLVSRCTLTTARHTRQRKMSI